MSQSIEADPGIWLQKSAREWQRVQVGVLGFVGLCGMLRGDSGEEQPLWLQKSGGLAAVAALVAAILAVTFVATIAQPFGARSISLQAAQRRLRIGIGTTFVALGLTVISALGMWWPHETNKLTGGCYLRPIAFYGSEKMGVSPKGAMVHVAIAAWPWGAYLGAEGLEKGIRVKTSSFARHHINVTMCRAKFSGTYANSILANQEAVDHGYDEALLLDVDGYVAEGAGENLFLVKNGRLYEPELTSALIGITRDSVIQLAGDIGLEVHTKRITRDDIYIADEAFFTGTAAEVTPIRELDNRVIGAGKRGPVTEKLQSMFFDVVNGRNPKYAKWLTPIR